MAIATLDQYIAAAKQRITWIKTTSRTSVAAMPESLFNVAGNPGAGTLDRANTNPGLVHDDTYAGYPPINAFGGGASGYISKIEFGNTVACRIDLYDRLYVSGAWAFNAAAAIASPSFAARVPGGTDFTGLQLWFEALTAFTGNLSLAVLYTNQAAVDDQTTGTIATGIAPIVGRCVQLPLQAGDSGLRGLRYVTATVSSAGTFNLNILRPLWSGRVPAANGGR